MYWEAYYQLAPIAKNPNSGNFYGETPIHRAALNGHLEILKLLVSYTDDPNVSDSQGWTPIHWSANHLGLNSQIIGSSNQKSKSKIDKFSKKNSI